MDFDRHMVLTKGSQFNFFRDANVARMRSDRSESVAVGNQRLIDEAPLAFFAKRRQSVGGIFGTRVRNMVRNARANHIERLANG